MPAPSAPLANITEGNLPASANLVQTLIKHDLVDAFWLKIFPITLGGGKRLFTDGSGPGF
jgi:hypothetical protein